MKNKPVQDKHPSVIQQQLKEGKIKMAREEIIRDFYGRIIGKYEQFPAARKSALQ